MSSELAIRVQGLGKTYHLYDSPLDRLKQMVAPAGRRHYREFTALDDVSFELRKGEVLGLVGRNGAGKSTLLQLICGTLTPSRGTVEVNGRVAALLELGAGFNPDFTGAENVQLNASILGLTRAEIEQRYDEIVAFSGIGDFIHQPVKTYSSGMYVRLAFAIATSVDPDILVIDEALSVGDGAFARKSFDRIMQLKERGATILFCSHSMYQVEALCSRALWLERGRVKEQGESARVVARYQDHLDRDAAQAAKAQQSLAQAQPQAPAVSGHARIVAVECAVDGAAGTALPVRSGCQQLDVKIGFASDPALPVPTVAVTLNAADGRILASSSTQIDQVQLPRDEGGRGTATISFDNLPLLKGEYFVWVYLLCENGIHIYDQAANVATLHVSQSSLEQGLVALPRRWSGVPGVVARTDLPEEPPAPLPDDPLDLLAQTAFLLPEGEALPAAAAGRLDPQAHQSLAGRFGLAWQQGAGWRKTRQPRWRPGWVRRDDRAAWHALFQSAFGYAMSPNLWEWKYRDAGDLLGTGAWDRQGALVAFYGGMPRPIRYLGRPELAVQIGDVMVHPEHRGVLTRSGPFQLAASSFLEQQIGDGRRFLLGFGFPEDKALKLAERLGLYAQVDGMTELRWPAASGRSPLSLYARPLTHRQGDAVDALWQRMAAALGEQIVGVRDWNYVRQRFLAHPFSPYAVLLVRQRLGNRPLGLVVLRDREQAGVELVDFVGDPADFELLLGVARRYAGRLGRAEVFAWITASQAPRLAVAGASVHPLPLAIPTNTWSPGLPPDAVQGRWWLMGGDTDFR